MKHVIRRISWLLLAAALWIPPSANGSQDDKKQPQPLLKPGQSIKPFKTNYFEARKLAMTLTSDEMIPLDAKNDNMELIKPSAILYLDPRQKGEKVTRVTITSAKGHVHVPTRMITLKESVELITSTGARLETTELVVDSLKKRAVTDRPFRFSEPGLDVTGTGLELDYSGKSLWIKKDMHGKLTEDPRKIIPGAPPPKSAADRAAAEETEFWSAEGLRRGTLSEQESKDRNATEWIELNKQVKVIRTAKTPGAEQHEALSCEYLKIFLRRESPAQGQNTQDKKPEIAEILARERVALHSSRGGSMNGDELTWTQRDDIAHIRGKPLATGRWGQQNFTGRTIVYDRAHGLLRCSQQASAQMQPEREGQSPMTIDAEQIEATIVPVGEDHVLQKFLAEKNVVLSWKDPDRPEEAGRASRAEGQRFEWNHREGMGTLTDRPFAKIFQAGSTIESPTITVYNNPQRIILKGPKRLILQQETAQGRQERWITSDGDMILDPAGGRIQMVRNVTVTGTDLRMVADSMEIVMTTRGKKEIEKLVGTGHVRLDHRAQGVSLMGDRLIWDPRTTAMEVSGFPYAFILSPDLNIQAGTIRYDEKTGQLEGYRGQQRTMLHVEKVQEKEKKP